VEVGEQREVGPQVAGLVGLRLLDLAHDVRPSPDLVCARDHLGASGTVGLVAEAGPLPGALLHEHLDAVGLQLPHPVGRDRHPALVGLHLGGDPDDERHGAQSAGTTSISPTMP
jgi:hypothetical protein